MTFRYTSRLLRNLLILSAISLLAGCSGGLKTFGPTIDELNEMTPYEVEAHIEGKTGRTIMTYGWAHGTQIEYVATDGRAYLWYPGNSRAVPSLWEVQHRGLFTSSFHRICGKYPTRSYNPVTREYGGYWQCDSINAWAKRIPETREGDIFNLSSGKVPWVLSKDKTTFDELLAKMPRK